MKKIWVDHPLVQKFIVFGLTLVCLLATVVCLSHASESWEVVPFEAYALLPADAMCV